METLSLMEPSVLAPEKDSESWEIEGDAWGAGYRIRVASDRGTRQRAYAFANRLYGRAGLLPVLTEDGFKAQSLLVCPYDARPDTFTLLAEDLEGRVAGTMTLVFDAPEGLPCDEIYGAEVDALREGGARIVEATRLSLDDEALFSEQVFLRLINFLFIYGVRVRRCTDLVIEVNPRHVKFYRRMLRFEPLGPERPCPRVNGAPAVLLGLKTEIYAREMQRQAGLAHTDDAQGVENLYARFFPRAQEERIARFLAQGQRPMSAEELRSFGLASA